MLKARLSVTNVSQTFVVKLLWLLICAGTLTRLLVPFIRNPIEHLWSDPGRWWEHALAGVDPPPIALIDPPM